MTRNEIIKQVNQVFSDDFEIEPKKLRPEANLFLELGLDSLDVVDLIVALQQKFSVSIRDDERIRDIRTLEDLYTFIETISKTIKKS